ncbi:MAG TPA: hypothetical protein VNJ01_17490 [Bacteriovoracaceae bacterium]|nr:hypothetical protein [Bacteriovoracaceae bacterium]
MTDETTDEFNPLQAAKFMSEIQNAMGIKTSVAQEYEEFEKFELEAFLNEQKP